MTKSIFDYRLLWIVYDCAYGLNGSMGSYTDFSLQGYISTLAHILQIDLLKLSVLLKRFIYLFTRIKSFRVTFYPRSVIQLEVKYRVYGKRQMWDSTELRNFQNEKWADKNSLKQLLWIELAWIYRFSCSCNEQ